MKTALNKYRIAILAGFGLLVLLLGLMVSNLLTQLRELSIAEGDDTQWSIAQLDTEFSNLNAVLSDQLLEGEFSDAQIRLRFDIALSRLSVINFGRTGTEFAKNNDALPLIEELNGFADAVIAYLDQESPLSAADLSELRLMVQDIRPVIRRIALLGVTLGAAHTEERRSEFAAQLTRTGGIAIALLLMLVALLLVLDRLLRRAALRDAKLLTSSKQLASTVAASLDAIVTADDKGRIIAFNAAAQSIFGWAPEQIIGKTMEETIIPTQMREAHHAGMNRYLQTGTTRVIDKGRVELSALRKGGEEFPVELNITSIQDGEGTKFIAYIRDISSRKINEQKLIDARNRAERTDRAKSQFLTVMSHEMRTPLNGILGVLDLLKTTELTQQQERYVQIATASGEILLEHTNEALDITRIETGSLQLAMQDFYLPAMVETLVDGLEPLAREKNLGLSLQIDDSMRMGFWGDSNRIRQILTNLLGNAIKFTETGHISLTVTGIHGREVSSVAFSVTDTGAGIAPEHQEQVFDDFVALASGKGRQSRGDGLGLSISRKIALGMGGDISLQSTVGAGSTFTLTLPLTRGETTEAQSDIADAATNAPRQACRVLVVEDNNVNRKVLGDMLEGMGHEVQEAVNGAESLIKAAQTSFDLIFMDISMPVMGGIEATKRLRNEGGLNATTPIVGLTAHGKEEYREAAQNAGMSFFHTKPIRLATLHGILSQVLVTGSEVSSEYPKPAEENDALDILIDALGRDKVNDVGASFFAELEVYFDQIEQGAFDGDPVALAEATHKMKGAAALLGQGGLEDALAVLEDCARAGEVSDLTNRLNDLQQRTTESRLVFNQKLG